MMRSPIEATAVFSKFRRNPLRMRCANDRNLRQENGVTAYPTMKHAILAFLFLLPTLAAFAEDHLTYEDTFTPEPFKLSDGTIYYHPKFDDEKVAEYISQWSQTLLQHIRDADAIEVCESSCSDDDPVGKVLWSIQGRDKLKELAGLIQIEEAVPNTNYAHYAYYDGYVRILRSSEILETLRLVHPLGIICSDSRVPGHLRLTEASEKNVAEWFRRNGWSEYCQGAYEPEQDSLNQRSRLAQFKAYFSDVEIALLFPVIKAGLSDDAVQDRYQFCINSLLKESKDRVDLLTRLFMALGMTECYNYWCGDECKMIAEKVAERADDADFMEALNRISGNNFAILGASEAFIRRCMTDVLVEPDKSCWTIRIASARLKDTYSAEKIRMLDLLDKLETPDAISEVAYVATGLAEQSPYFSNYFGTFSLRFHACELLVKRCSGPRAGEIGKRLSACREYDSAELARIALSLALDPKIASNDIMMALADDGETSLQLTDTLSSCRDVEVFQRLVDLMEEDGCYHWLWKFADSFQKATGHEFVSLKKDEYIDDWIREAANRQIVRDWWAANRERLAAEWAAE